MIYRLYTDPITPSEAARCLAQVRQDRAREFIRATARQMCVDMGREIPGALL